MTSTLSRAARLLPAIFAVALACDDDDPVSPGDDVVVAEYSFEQGLGDWQVEATDVFVGDDEVDWSVTVTDERAAEGTNAVRFTVENLSDAAKVWVEREFELEPNTTYDVDLAFAFGTGDWSDVNLWTIIAGVLPDSPESTADLEPAFQGDTGHDQGEAAGVVWLDKSYDLTVTTDADGLAHLVVGVWGTYEVTRSYWVDDVAVVFTPTP